MTQRHRAKLFGVLSLLVIGFIFANSLQGSVESNARSEEVAGMLDWLLNPFGWLSEEHFHKLVRKLAHFTEFSVLGFCLGGTFLSSALGGKKQWICPGLTVLGVACLDETIQSFTGRTNSIKDVLLDFGGGLCGLLFLAGTHMLIRQFQRSHQKEPNTEE